MDQRFAGVTDDMDAGSRREAVIVGRGSSIRTARIPYGIPLIAVSSGVFACPRKPRYFVTLDSVKYFYHPPIITAPGAWSKDPNCTWWDFLSDPSVEKWVPDGKASGFYREWPRSGHHDTLDIEEAMLLLGHTRPDLTGWQAGWDEHPSLRTYAWKQGAGPNFDATGPIGSGGYPTHKSILAAVQIAHRLGFERLYFAGVDLHSGKWEYSLNALKEWQAIAQARGFEWLNLSTGSTLTEFMRTEESDADHDDMAGRQQTCARQ